MSGEKANTKQSDQLDRPEALRNELLAWRHNRKVYPGWLIAPYQTRDKLWLHTRYWLDVAVDIGPNWPSPHLLILWRELSWRLGICLQVLPDEALDVIRTVTDELTDPIQAGDDPRKNVFPDKGAWPGELVPSTTEFRNDWIACLLSLLGGYRIRPDIQAFQQIEKKLTTLGGLSEDQHSHIVYQSCLRAFSELERDQAWELVAKWPSQPEDPYWLVRKAAVLLELGDGSAARSAADDALEQIRRRHAAADTDHWKLSREGWCLKLLARIDWNLRYSAKVEAVRQADNTGAKQNRLDHQLEIARCSPDTELLIMRERISNRYPPARPAYRITNPPDFDSGFTHESVRIVGEQPATRLAPAINILLASDLTGLPLTNEPGASAMQWIRDEYPGLWAAFALRFDGIGITQERDPSGETRHHAIRRTTLQKLPSRHLERLFTAAMRELENIVDLPDGTTRHRPFQSARQLADVVTRFSLCLDDSVRPPILKLALRIARVSTYRRHPLGAEMLRQLLERIVPFLTIAQFNEILFELLIRFPLNGSDDNVSDRWPYITHYIHTSDTISLVRPNADEIDAGIKMLIDHVRSHDIKTRTDAALRLLRLSHWHFLSTAELQSYQRALWDVVDPQGLPKVEDDNVARSVHLDWPTDSPECRIKGLATWITSESVKDRFEPATDAPDDVPARNRIRWPDPDKYLPHLLDLADRLRSSPNEFATLFDEPRRQHILHAILAWWDRERTHFQYHHTVGLFGGDVFDRADLALQVIFNCVLGTNVPNTTSLHNLHAFLRDIQEFRAPSPYSYPILAYLEPQRQAHYWNRLRQGLWSGEPDIARKALVACRQLQRRHDELKLMRMPSLVFEALVTAIANLQAPLSYDVYYVVSQLIADGHFEPEYFDLTEVADAVCSAASKLEYDDHETTDNTHTGFDDEMRSHFRRQVAELLSVLRQRDVRIGSVASEWIKKATTDRFVDVRRAASG